MKKLVEDFKKFISRGSVIDLAVGIIIGAAFTQIVNSLVNDIIMPPIGLLFGGAPFEELKIILKEATDTSAQVSINYGIFLSKVLDFFIIAVSVFLLIRLVNRARDGIEKGTNAVKEIVIKNIGTKQEAQEAERAQEAQDKTSEPKNQ